MKRRLRANLGIFSILGQEVRTTILDEIHGDPCLGTVLPGYLNFLPLGGYLCGAVAILRQVKSVGLANICGI